MFTTGYDRSMIPAKHAARPKLAKPFLASQLIDRVLSLPWADCGAVQVSE
jgi:hypothetical protein